MYESFRYFLTIHNRHITLAYIRSHPQLEVENNLEKLQKPSNGHYVFLIRNILLSFHDDKEHFFAEVVQWYLTAHKKDTENAKLINELVKQRNLDAHGTKNSESELKNKIESLIDSFEKLLQNAEWLIKYRIFRTSENDTFMDNLQKKVGLIEISYFG